MDPMPHIRSSSSPSSKIWTKNRFVHVLIFKARDHHSKLVDLSRRITVTYLYEVQRNKLVETSKELKNETIQLNINALY